MTFLELEKECKKRRVKRFLLIFVLVIFSVILIAVTIFELNRNSKISKRANFKEVNKTKIEKKANRIKKVTSYKENIKLVPIIDLDVNITSENNLTSLKLEDKKNKILKKDKNLSKVSKKSTNFIKSTSLPDFNKSIAIAKEYFKKADYKLALKWAKIANIQNKKDKISWIIAAKSLFYLGKKDKAIKILEIYYNFNKDKEIKKLIDTLKKER